MSAEISERFSAELTKMSPNNETPLSEAEIEALRFPIGQFEFDPEITEDKRAAWIGEFSAAPARMREAVAGLTDEQLDTQYRPEGWTLRQVVHHTADSHVNTYSRIRLPLTEDRPTISVYDEKAWAELPDAKSGPLEPSLLLLEGLHARLTAVLRSLTPEQFARELTHPEMGHISIDTIVQFYAWDSNHHIAHITKTREKHGW